MEKALSMHFYSKNKQKKTRKNSCYAALLSSTLLCLIYTKTCSAFETDLFIGNAKAMSLGNAVTADPPHIDAIYFNPAGLAKLEGVQIQVKAIGAAFELQTELHAPDFYQNLLKNINLTDPILDANGNATSRTTQFDVQVPGAGLVKLPIPGGILGGISYKPEQYSRWTFANSVFAPLIAGVHRTDPAGAFIGKDIGATRLTYFAPTVGYKFTEDFWVGAGLNISYFGVGADISLRFPDLLLAATSLVTGEESVLCSNVPQISILIDSCNGGLRPTDTLADVNVTLEDYFSPTYNLGFLWHVTNWLTWGGVYHSGSQDKLEGDLEIKYSEQIKNLITGLNNNSNPALLAAIRFLFPAWPADATDDSTKTTVDFEYPAHAATGIKVQLLPRWSMNVDIKWTESSAWDQWTANFTDPVEVLGIVGILTKGVSTDYVEIPRNYQNYWTYGVGIEHLYNHRLTLRGGYEYRASPIPDDRGDAVVPIGEMHILGTGLNFKINQNSDIDLAAAFITSKTTIPACSSPNANDCSVSSLIYSPYSGLDVKHTLNVALFEAAYQLKF